MVIETRSREYVETRVRAGLLEQGTVDLMERTGLGERMRREGLSHHGIALRFGGRSHRIDFDALTGGKGVTVYAQQEVVKDLIAARLAAGGDILFEVRDVSVADLDGPSPRIRFTDAAGHAREIACDFVGGCDGFHAICRPSVPAGVLTEYERVYPFAWLGILSHSPPPS